MKTAIEFDPVRGSLPQDSPVFSITTSTAFPDPSEHLKCMSRAPLTPEELCTLKELMNTEQDDHTPPENFPMPSVDLSSSLSSPMPRVPAVIDLVHAGFDLLQEMSSPTSSVLTGNNATRLDDTWSFRPFGIEYMNPVASSTSTPPTYGALSEQPGSAGPFLVGDHISHVISEDTSSPTRICMTTFQKNDAMPAQKNRPIRRKQESAASGNTKPDVQRKDLKKGVEKPCAAELRAIRARRNRESARRSREKAKLEYQRMLDTYNRLKTENELLRRLADKLALEFGSDRGTKDELAERTSQSSIRQGCH